MLKEIYKDVIKDFGTRTYNDIESRKPEVKSKFDFLTDDIQRYITDITADKVVLITETTKKLIKLIVGKAIAEGKSIPETEDLIDKLYLDQIIPNRSRTIARTEVVSASNYGSIAGAKQTSPKLFKVWIPTFDDSTRETHLTMANHPPIGLDEQFNVGGYYAQQPGDFSLPASEVINCRCAIGYEYAQLPSETTTVKVDETTVLKESILQKNKSAFAHLPDAADYELELKNYLDNVSENDLIVYDKLSNFISTSDYKYTGSVHYSAKDKKVKMDIQYTPWEKHMGLNMKGGLKTKFHEEFHQLDDILSKTEFSKDENGNFISYYGVSSVKSINGKKLYESTKKDVLNAINRAIDEQNIRKGYDIKHIKSLDRIPKDVKNVFANWITENYNDQKKKAQINMFTDAIGGVTGGRISPHTIGLWGHSDDYYKKWGDDAAGAEMFAEYGAYRFVYDDETKRMINELMPETIKTLDIVYNDITDYLKNNDLKYSR